MGRRAAPIVALGASVALAPGEVIARPLTTGLAEFNYASTSPAVRVGAFNRSVRAGAGIVRLAVHWRDLAPLRPVNPANPASYYFGVIDEAVRDASARNLKIILILGSAPNWAEGRNRPASALPGTWRPDAGAFGQFSKAVAGRYSGRFPDPLHPGASLPRVRYFQAWNEPNLSTYLTPQWTHGKAASPTIYRWLLNAFYAGVKSVHRHNLVLTGGTAPFGDAGRGARMRPVRFLRGLLCLKGRSLRRARCRNPAHLDVLAHHPISDSRPEHHALHPDDATTPDIGRIRRVLRKATRTGRALPAGSKPIWVTEFWWDSRPPDPRGLPLGRQARYLEKSLYLFWRQRVPVAVWLQVSDQPRGPGYRRTSQTGLFFLNGRPKPALTAFRFPFVTERISRRWVRVWVRPPEPGEVRIQRRSGGHWRTIGRLAAAAGVPAAKLIRLNGPAELRARSESRTSLVWSQR